VEDRTSKVFINQALCFFFNRLCHIHSTSEHQHATT